MFHLHETVDVECFYGFFFFHLLNGFVVNRETFIILTGDGVPAELHESVQMFNFLTFMLVDE